jgi:hypothetical protein
VAVVVDWPFKFGPQGGPWNVWDSDYCQYAILEHARHRFLSLAAGVVSLDVDELVITEGRTSIYELLTRSRTGYLLFPGIWIESATKAGNGTRRHLDYVYRLIRPTEGMDPKWAAVPARCSPQSQWAVHHIIGMQSDDEAAPLVSFRHFRAINTNWRLARWHPEEPDERKHVIDEDLVRCFRVFDCPAR